MIKILIQKACILFVLCTVFAQAQQKELLQFPDGKIAYQTFGDGYPVLIINGGPGLNSNGFAPLAEMFSLNNTTIIYDQRGTGDSDLKHLNSSTLTMKLMVEDIEKLRKHLGFKEWIILGHSFGGMLAYAYAADYPDRVRAMIQSHSGGIDLELLENLEITSSLTATQQDSLAYHSMKIRRGDTSHATALKRGKLLAHAYLYNKEFLPQIAERLTQGNFYINSVVWSNMRLNGYDAKPKLRYFNKPVLILQGKNEVVPISLAEKAHKLLPNSKLVIIEECGHYGWLDRPDVYLPEVRHFLAENSAAGY